MKNILILASLALIGCANTDSEVLNYNNRCENFERETSPLAGFEDFDNNVHRVAPQYPAEASRKRIEGYVVMVYDITEQGKTDNIEVIESYPSDIFENEAKRSLSQWIYKPAEKDSKPVRSPCHQVSIEFKIE
ncbi:energy transducer TonB [Aliiglaciecola litoralis]|uniref:Protein TonB n=1 Tax=Aliiglaciecola litoralis TaxID=582857 RepID=A0ABN1LDN5_9ALTE